MKIISFNANGIRSAARKSFFVWLQQEEPDVVCLQETRAQLEQLQPDPLFFPSGYHCTYVAADKKGYSGVAIYAKRPPLHVVTSIGCPHCDSEGRYVQYDYSNFSVVSLYLPSGTGGELRQAVKYQVLDTLKDHFKRARGSKKTLIICGDFNIAHRPIDLKNWRSNQTNSGFLPEERAWMDELFGTMGYVDAFRTLNSQPEQYTWWSNRGQARRNNVGWRIDYQVISPDLINHLDSASIYTEQPFSDHAPVIITYTGLT